MDDSKINTEPPVPAPALGPADRTRVIEHKGHAIILMDFSQLKVPQETLAVIDAATRFVAAQPKVQNLRTLVDVSGSVYDYDVLEALKALAAHNKPWVLAGAVVGLSPLRRLAVRIVCFFSGRKLASFKTLEEAKEWLVAQQAPPAEVPETAGDAE
jgi:hypothetical protein